MNGDPDVAALREIYRRGGGVGSDVPAPPVPNTTRVRRPVPWRWPWVGLGVASAGLAALWTAGFPAA